MVSIFSREDSAGVGVAAYVAADVLARSIGILPVACLRAFRAHNFVSSTSRKVKPLHWSSLVSSSTILAFSKFIL